MVRRRWLLVAFVFVLVVLAALMYKHGQTAASAAVFVLGGGIRSRPAPKHVVVDTLNLTHWREKGCKQITPEQVIRTIEETAPALLAQYDGGRVMYVVKDRDSTLNTPEAREAYAAAAEKCGVYVNVVERYESGEPQEKNTEHAAGGRDDFYMALLAKRWNCCVLTEDRFRDFDKFRKAVKPFHVYEYAYWRALPERAYINPKTETVKKPRGLRYTAALKKSSRT